MSKFDVMGFRKWLLGFDPEEFKDVKARLNLLESKVEKVSTIVETLKEELNALYKTKADIELVKSIESKLSQMDNLINELKATLTTNLRNERGEKELSTADKCDLVLNMIKQGINTSSELRKHVPFSVRELHKILKRLEELSVIGQIKKGRTKYYYIIEAKNQFVHSKELI